MDKKSNLRRDFEIFSKGIQRLEELRAELDSLNARGHEADAARIRARLKNVSDIPIIEADLKRLKSKIAGRYKLKPRRKKSYTEEKIKKLEGEIKHKTALSRRDSKYIKEIPQLKAELDSLRRAHEREKEEERRKHEILRRIDPSVDLLSNEVFDLSLNEIKAELSDRMRQKESAVQKELNEDLKIREDAFKKKYGDIEEKFHNMYNYQVEHQLKRDVQKKFKKLLKAYLKQRKAELTGQELRTLREAAQREFDIRKEELRKKISKELAETKRKMKQHFEEELLLHRHELHQKFEQDVSEEVRRLRREQEEKEREMKISMQEFRQEQEEKERKMKRGDEEFRRMLEEKEKEMKRNMEEEKEKEIQDSLREKTRQLRGELRKEFEQRMKLEMKRKEVELERKKMAFEEEIQKKAKMLFS
jgi:hypothetical protein